MGFFHRPRSGRPSLALYLAEELRHLTDGFVVSLVRRCQLDSDSFTTTPGGAVYLSDEGRTDLIKAWEAHKEIELQHPIAGRGVARWALPSVHATLLAQHARRSTRLPAFRPRLSMDVLIAYDIATRTESERPGFGASPRFARSTASGCNSRCSSAGYRQSGWRG